MSFAIDNHEARSKENVEKTLDLIAPFMPRAVVNELCSGRYFEEYRKRKLAELRAATYRAIWEQRQMARETWQRETRFVNGIGQWKMIVHPLLRGLAEKKWGRGCWNDKSFQKDTLAKCPELRVPAPKPRFIPVNGFKISRRPGSREYPTGKLAAQGMARRENLRQGSGIPQQHPAPIISETMKGSNES
jgi:hypothetical protein